MPRYDGREPLSPPRFLADAMLGRLARWLRMLGFDTLYPGGHDLPQPDEALLAQAVSQGRTLLTRDKKLGSHPAVFPVDSDNVQTQLVELAESLGPPFYRVIGTGSPRCTLCNGILELFRSPNQVTTCSFQSASPTPPPEQRRLDAKRRPADGHQILDEKVWSALPEGVRASQRRFWRCGGCQQIYWKGTHWERVEDTRRRLSALREP